MARFDVFLAGVALSLAGLSAAVVERATGLRARYSLKAPDACDATAIKFRAAEFLAGDRGLPRRTEVPVEML